MGTLVILEMPAKRDSLVELQAYLKRILPETRRFEGCQDIHAWLAEDGRTIVLVQRWDSVDAYQRYLAWRQETGVFADIMAMLDGETGMRFFTPIEA